ncbi:MAG: Hg(II)-responsive transcriptional regulator [Methylococcaceae bacterium]|nr:MAG: Hg(II)-responsive transcriptional regulator [Methylococcaceae bacterium]
MSAALTIGQLARAAGVNVETIRYYQRRGLLDQPDKPAGACRRYSVDAAKRIRCIKQAQALGFTLNEIGSLLHLDGADCCAETRELAVRKLASIEAKLADLTTMRAVLAALIEQCDSGVRGAACPIIHALTKE